MTETEAPDPGCRLLGMQHATEDRGERATRRRPLRIRRWLVVAATLAALAVAAPAAASLGTDGGRGTADARSATADDPGSRTAAWLYVVIAAAVVFGLTTAGAALIRTADNRRRLAELAD